MKLFSKIKRFYRKNSKYKGFGMFLYFLSGTLFFLIINLRRCSTSIVDWLLLSVWLEPVFYEWRMLVVDKMHKIQMASLVHSAAQRIGMIRSRVRMQQNTRQMQVFRYQFKDRPSAYLSEEKVLTYNTAHLISKLVFDHPDFIERFVAVERTTEPDENGDYLYQLEITIIEKTNYESNIQELRD